MSVTVSLSAKMANHNLRRNVIIFGDAEVRKVEETRKRFSLQTQPFLRISVCICLSLFILSSSFLSVNGVSNEPVKQKTLSPANEKPTKTAPVPWPSAFVAGEPSLLSRGKGVRHNNQTEFDLTGEGSMLVDGDRNDDRDCLTTTSSDGDALWFQVDLGGQEDLARVVIANSLNYDIAKKTRDFFIYARKDNKTDLRGVEEGKCGPLVTTPLAVGENRAIACEHKNVRYVTLWKDLKNSPPSDTEKKTEESMQLCEIEIFGYDSGVKREEGHITALNLSIDT